MNASSWFATNSSRLNKCFMHVLIFSRPFRLLTFVLYANLQQAIELSREHHEGDLKEKNRLARMLDNKVYFILLSTNDIFKHEEKLNAAQHITACDKVEHLHLCGPQLF